MARLESAGIRQPCGQTVTQQGGISSNITPSPSRSPARRNRYASRETRIIPRTITWLVTPGKYDGGMSNTPIWTNPLRDPRDLRLPRIAGPCSLVIFGVTGDLAQKKLLPAVYDLANRGLLPPSFGLTGFARRDWTNEHFIEFVKTAVKARCRTPFKEST